MFQKFIFLVKKKNLIDFLTWKIIAIASVKQMMTIDWITQGRHISRETHTRSNISPQTP